MKPRLNYPYTMTSQTIEFEENFTFCFAIEETGVISINNVYCNVYNNSTCIWKHRIVLFMKWDQTYIIKLFIIEIRESNFYHHLN